jgi:hypothetical protein
MNFLTDFISRRRARREHPECKTCQVLTIALEEERVEKRRLQDILFRITRLEGPQVEHPKESIGGFEPLRLRRTRLEREARLRANNPKDKGWKNIEELEKEVDEPSTERSAS